MSDHQQKVQNNARDSTVNSSAEDDENSAETAEKPLGLTTRNVTRVRRNPVMRRRKCLQCKQWYVPINHEQRFCSDACRQKNYRKRHTKRKRQVDATRPSEPKQCPYCRKSFWGTAKQVYCSASCRTLAHRARRESTVKLLAAMPGVGLEKALIIVEKSGMKKVVAGLLAQGFVYDEILRAWEKK